MFTLEVKFILLFITLTIITASLKGKKLYKGMGGALMGELHRIESIKNPQQKGREGELFIANLLERSGHKNVKTTPPKADGGRDVDSTYQGENWAYEVKFWKYNEKDWRSRVGEDVGRSIMGHCLSKEHRKPKRGAIVTTSYFSPKCKLYCERNNIKMVDRDNLVKWINKLDD